MDKNNRRLLILLVVLVILFLTGPLVGSAVMGSGTMWGFGPRSFTETGGWAWGLAMGLGSLDARFIRRANRGCCSAGALDGWCKLQIGRRAGRPSS